MRLGSPLFAVAKFRRKSTDSALCSALPSPAPLRRLPAYHDEAPFCGSLGSQGGRSSGEYHCSEQQSLLLAILPKPQHACVHSVRHPASRLVCRTHQMPRGGLGRLAPAHTAATSPFPCRWATVAEPHRPAGKRFHWPPDNGRRRSASWRRRRRRRLRILILLLATPARQLLLPRNRRSSASHRAGFLLRPRRLRLCCATWTRCLLRRLRQILALLASCCCTPLLEYQAVAPLACAVNRVPGYSGSLSHFAPCTVSVPK